MRLWQLMLGALAGISGFALAFAPSRRSHHVCHEARCVSSSSSIGGPPPAAQLLHMMSDHEDALARRTDIRNFLTQRAVQSFIFLLLSCRDPHSVRWLEKTYDFKNLENYHGTGAFNLTKFGTWDVMLRDMLSRPAEVVIVSARRRGRGHGGWSTDNPYLEDRFVEFEIDIDPPSLVSRIVSVRDQIAKEWVVDLETFIMANEMILQSYHSKHVADRDEEECKDFATPEECDELEALVAPYADPYQKNSVRAYERIAMTLLNNKIVSSKASSPNRKGNFDLLELLATQESVHRVLREYREAGDVREVSFRWLRDHYVNRLPTYFDGNQEYGRADDFLDELLLTPPAMKELDGNVELIDPMRIAEDLICARAKVAADWKSIVECVPQDHMELQKILLAVRMGKYDELSLQNSRTESSADGAGRSSFE